MPDLKPIYTGSERARLTRLLAKGSRYSAAGADTDDIDRQIDAIREAGQERAQEAYAEQQAARKAAERELRAARDERRHLGPKKRAAAIRAANAAKVKRSADRAGNKVRNKSSWW